MERTQFTFYESFYKALSRIRKDADRAKAYDAIVRFALYGDEPDLDSLPDNVAIAYELVRPNVEASRRKAEAGRKGGESKPEAKPKQKVSKAEANSKQNASKPEANWKQEREQVREQVREQMLPPHTPQGDFERFWSAYPKRVGKDAALKAFKKIKGVSIDTMIQAIEAQKQSEQWQKSGGQFIPNPATWLNQGRWEDEVTVSTPTTPSQPSRKAQPVPADYGMAGTTVDTGDIDWLLREGLV